MNSLFFSKFVTVFLHINHHLGCCRSSGHIGVEVSETRFLKCHCQTAIYPCCLCCFLSLLKGHLVIRSFCNLSLACYRLMSLGTDLSSVILFLFGLYCLLTQASMSCVGAVTYCVLLFSLLSLIVVNMLKTRAKFC